MTDVVGLREDLRRRQYEVPVQPRGRLCVCVADVPGAPVGAYVANPGCRECRGIGVVPVPGPPKGFETLPPDHPAQHHQDFVVGRPHDPRCSVCNGRRPA